MASELPLSLLLFMRNDADDGLCASAYLMCHFDLDF